MPANFIGQQYFTGPVTADIKEWRYDPRGVFWGRIYGDTKKRWRDGTYFHTSSVMRIEPRDDCFIVITLNSAYRLWKCDAKDKEKDYDDAGAGAGEIGSSKASV